MRWEKETTKRHYIFDLLISQEIIYDAFKEGYLNWTLYNMAINKIKSNINGVRNGFWKYETPDLEV